MNPRTIAIGAALAALIFCGNVAARSAGTDRGVIEALYEHEIHVQGEEGLHVLEPMEECSWCAEGVEVAVTFLKYARATLKPVDESRGVKPLKCWVLRDGRGGS